MALEEHVTMLQFLLYNQKQSDPSGWENGAVGPGWSLGAGGWCLGAACPGRTCPTTPEQNM